jgi:hypothetical protein
MSPRIPLVFGEGLDRETGVQAVRQSSMEDLRNVLLFEGKATVRKGIVEQLTIAGTTHLLAIQAIRAERKGIVIVYDSATGDVDVWGVDAEATTATLLGTWFTKASDLTEPPIISTAELFGQVFMAHSTFSVTNRATTYVYDRRQAPVLFPLQADLDDDGTKDDIKFKGVGRYTDYLMGWGYGDETDQERPEFLRVSKPGEPADPAVGANDMFQAEHYFIVGDPRDPIITCEPAGDSYLVFKETETYRFFGYSRSTFGVKPVDPLFGCVGPRLSVSVSGLCFFWTSQGPRVSDGRGPSGDAGLPLDYFGFDPADLITQGATDTAFACYAPIQRVVMFVFGRRVYAFTVRSGLAAAKWSYWELEFDPFCCGILYAGDTGVFPAPTGFPTCTSVDGTAGTSMLITWANNSQDADEFIEIWTQLFQQLVLDWEMDTDGGGGVASSFASSTGAAHTTVFSIDSAAQKIAVSAATGADFSGVDQGTPAVPPNQTIKVTAGETYMLEVEAKAANLVGGARGTLTIKWYDNVPALISTETRVTFTGTAFALYKLEATAPGGAVAAEIHFEFESQASGDIGDVWFKNARFFDSSAVWNLADTDNVSAASSQVSNPITTTPGSFYRVRLRYGRGFEYTAGYTSGDPDNWPDTSECVVQTNITAAGVTKVVSAWYILSDNTKHSRVVVGISQAAWAALQAAGATAGLEIEVDSGSGFGAMTGSPFDAATDLIAGPLRNGENLGVVRFGYDHRVFGKRADCSSWGPLPVRPNPYTGPWPYVAVSDDLVLFEFDHDNHGHVAKDLTYRARTYIGSAVSGWFTDEAIWAGPFTDPEAVACNTQPQQEHGPRDFGLSSSGAGIIDITIQHADWFDSLASKFCEGFPSTVHGGHYYSSGFLPTYECEIWYEDPGSPGYILKTPRLQCDDIDDTIPETDESITGLTAATWNVKIRYRFIFNGTTYYGDYSVVKTVVVA